MHNRWQYQSNVEPLLPIQEPAQIDKWTPSVSTPVHRRALSAAILAGALFFTPLVAAVEAATIDKWSPSIAQPRAIQRTVNSGFTSIDPLSLALPEPTHLSKWYSALSEPVRLRRKPYETNGVHINPPTVVVPGHAWIAPLDTPKALQRTVNSGLISVDPTALALPEPPTLSKWFTQLSEPIRQGKRPTHTESIGPVEAPAPPVYVDVDPFTPMMDLPLPPVHTIAAIQAGSLFITMPVLEPVWASIDLPSQHLRRKRPVESLTVISPIAFFSPPPIVPVSATWEPHLAQPRLVYRRRTEGLTVVDPIAFLTPPIIAPPLDALGPYVSQPVLQGPRIPNEWITISPTAFLTPAIVPPPLNAWLPRMHGLAPIRPRRTDGLTIIDPGELALPGPVPLSAWVPAMDYVTRLALHRPYLYDLAIPGDARLQPPPARVVNRVRVYFFLHRVEVVDGWG